MSPTTLAVRSRVTVLAFENITPRFQEVHWIQRPPIYEYFIVYVRPSAAPGRTEQPDLLAIIHGIAHLNVNPGQMAIARVHAQAMIDLNQPTVAAHPAGRNHHPRR